MTLRGGGLRHQAALAPSSDSASKPLSYYGHYDDFILRHSVPVQTLIEVGTYQGESAHILARAYPESRILTIDLVDRGIDFSNVPNVTFLCKSQSDPELADVVSAVFPDGVDLVIDDASHFGYESMMTFNSLFPLLKSGGGYFVEDWGTGYWDSWTDGSRFQRFLTETPESAHPKRFPSHDFGMVGFVKSLVDLAHDTSNYDPAAPPPPRNAPLKAVEFRAGVVMCLKA